MDSGLPFGPSVPVATTPRLDVPAESLRRALCGAGKKKRRAHSLWVRRIRVVGRFDISGEEIKARLLAEDCVFADVVDLSQAMVVDLRLVDCEFEDEVAANQLEVRWNLECVDSRFEGGISIRGGKIGGQFCVDHSTLTGKTRVDGAIALWADHLVVGQGLSALGSKLIGEVRLVGAQIAGRLVLGDARLVCPIEEEAPGFAINAENLEVGGDVCGDRLNVKGELRLMGASIGGEMQLENAELEGATDSEGAIGPALGGDGLVLAQSFAADELEATGEVRLIGAKIEGELSIVKARFNGGTNPDGVTNAFSADRAEIDQGVFASEVKAHGALRLSSAKVGGQISLRNAELTCADDGKGTFGFALVADRAAVAGNFFAEGMKVVGQGRFPAMKVEGQMSLDDARFSARPTADGSTMAILADQMEVDQELILIRMSSEGEMRLQNVEVGGLMSFGGTELAAGEKDQACLNLIGSEIEELMFFPASLTGAVDFRRAAVRSLWDADPEGVLAPLPEELRLDDFTYLSLREPLDAKRRIKWIEASQRDRHRPGVYAELAEAFRRMGYPGDARRVEIASQRRASKDTGKWSPQRLWHYFLYLSVGYGYRDWYAGIWLVLMVAAGSVVFWQNESSFAPTTEHAPGFNAALYAIDVTVPVLGLGQADAWSPKGGLVWVSLALSVLGYVLLAALLAAAAGLLNRESS